MEKLLRLQEGRVCMDKEDRLVSIRKKKFFIKGLSNSLLKDCLMSWNQEYKRIS